MYQNLHLIRRADPEYVAVFGADHVYRMHVGQMVDYHFRPHLLLEVLEANASRDGAHDFGRDVIPFLIADHRVYAYDFRHNRIPGILPGGDPTYWRDVGTLEAYFDAHMELLGGKPPLNLRNRQWPIRTATYSDPPATLLCVDGSCVENSLVAEGCAVLGGEVRRAVLGRNVLVHRGSRVEEAVVNDGAVIGEEAWVRRAILDKGAAVPPRARIGYEAETEQRMYHVSRSGITVVPRASLHPPKSGHGAGEAGRPGVSCSASHSTRGVAQAG